MVFLSDTEAGIEARRNLKNILQKRGLHRLPFFWPLVSENKLFALNRIMFMFIFKTFGLKRVPLFWVFENRNDEEFQKEKEELFYRISNISSFYKNAPGKFFQVKILNIFGYQIFRTLVQTLRYKLRFWYKVPSECKDLYRTLDKEGIVVIPNFLSEDDFKVLEEEFNSNKENMVEFKNRLSSLQKPWYKHTVRQQGDNSNNKLSEIFRNHKLLRPLVESSARRKIALEPEVALFEWKCNDDEVGIDHQFDYEDMAHYDVSFPSFKVFYYINDVDKDNGSFCFAKGTHKLSLSRLIYDYKLSNSYYKIEGGKHHIPSDTEMKAMNIDLEPIEGKANTLVLFNVMGFHNRHRFNNTKSRKALFMNFRHLESLKNRLAGLR